VRVSLPAGSRRGVLGQGAWLTATSFPTRTSPVKRGKWVLTQLLCAEPPPPPPGVPNLAAETGGGGTMRQRMEAHRTQPQCAACHKVMDPIGFGLDGFDGIGAARTTDNGQPLDTTGSMPDGQAFSDAGGLASILGADARFSRCLTQKMFAFALGRGPQTSDAPYLDRLGADLTAGGDRLSALVEAIALSAPFRLRQIPSGGASP
jgi:hypothetical protein